MIRCPKCDEHEMTYLPWKHRPGGRWRCECGYIVWETLAKQKVREYKSRVLLPQFTKPGPNQQKHCGGRGLIHLPPDVEVRKAFFTRWEAHTACVRT